MDYQDKEENNKYQERIDRKTIKNKIVRLRDSLGNKNLSEGKINILTSGLNTKEDLTTRQRKIKRINNDSSARRITNDVSSDLINSEYNRMFNNKDK